MGGNKTLLPTLNEQTNEGTERINPEGVKDNSLVLPNLENHGVAKRQNGQPYLYGIGGTLYNQQNRETHSQAMTAVASNYIKLRPYLQANQVTSKQLKKIAGTH